MSDPAIISPDQVSPTRISSYPDVGQPSEKNGFVKVWNAQKPLLYPFHEKGSKDDNGKDGSWKFWYSLWTWSAVGAIITIVITLILIAAGVASSESLSVFGLLVNIFLWAYMYNKEVGEYPHVTFSKSD